MFQNVCSEIVGVNKAEKFAEWSFGPDYKDLVEGTEWALAWNLLHGDLYMIDTNNEIYSDMEKMAKIWKEHIEKD